MQGANIKKFVLCEREYFLEIVFVERDGEHDEHPREHPQHLQHQRQPVGLLLPVGGDGVGVAGGELGHHVHQRHVQEDACKPHI